MKFHPPCGDCCSKCATSCPDDPWPTSIKLTASGFSNTDFNGVFILDEIGGEHSSDSIAACQSLDNGCTWKHTINASTYWLVFLRTNPTFMVVNCSAHAVATTRQWAGSAFATSPPVQPCVDNPITITRAAICSTETVSTVLLEKL